MKINVNNVSLKGEDINLNTGEYYYIIDALYLNNIKSEINRLDKSKLDNEIQEKIFPYTDTPFAKIQADNSFQIRNIKKGSYEKLNSNNRRIHFSTDTGVVIFVKEKILSEFVKDFDYDNLVDNIKEDIDLKYWNNIISKYNQNDIGLILAPGIGSGYEFEGSGIYKIVT